MEYGRILKPSVSLKISQEVGLEIWTRMEKLQNRVWRDQVSATSRIPPEPSVEVSLNLLKLQSQRGRGLSARRTPEEEGRGRGQL